MKVWRKSERNPQPMHDPAHFNGTTRRDPVAPGDGGVSGRASVVHFLNGAHTKLHEHSGGQVLVIVHGRGFVETEGERIEVEEGNIIACPPGEKHRHGALPGQDMAHLTIAGGEAIWYDE